MGTINPDYYWTSVTGTSARTYDDLLSLAGSINLQNEEKELRKMHDFDVKKIIINGPKTIVIWADGTKTIVSCGEDDRFDPYAGFCAAYVKKVFGSTSAAKRIVDKALVIPEPKSKKHKTTETGFSSGAFEASLKRMKAAIGDMAVGVTTRINNYEKEKNNAENK